jgi:CBS domain containing-hemolysin-like protein
MGIVEFLILAALLFANAFFVAAEFALVKVRVSQIDELAEQGIWSAKIASRLLDRLDAYISASQVGITLASLGLGFVIEDSLEPMIESIFHWLGLPEFSLPIGPGLPLGAVFAFVFATFLHISLGELVPKSLAIRSAKSLSLLTAPPLLVFYYIFYPVIVTLNWTSDLIIRLMGLGRLDHSEVVHTEEELRHILSEGVQGGHLSRSERVMIENVLNLEEKTARRVMVPRPDIVYLSLLKSIDENLRTARRAGHTRFPLCQDDLTHVVGMIHVKDLFRLGGASGEGSRPDLLKLARPIPFLPESMQLDNLLLEFQRQKVHMAILLNEYGSVVGMVTLENVLEELVGPIQDEFDKGEKLQIEPKDDGSYDVDAACPLDVLAEVCGVEIPETSAETTGGMILDQLGRMAQVGEALVVGHHRLTVLEAEPTRIRRVRVEPITATAPEHEEKPHRKWFPGSPVS